MSSTTEDVAKALQEYPGGKFPYNQLPEKNRVFIRGMARAAITAFKESYEYDELISRLDYPHEEIEAMREKVSIAEKALQEVLSHTKEDEYWKDRTSWKSRIDHIIKTATNALREINK